MPTNVRNFNFLALLVSEIKMVSQNLMWGPLAPYRIPYAETFTCAQGTCQGQTTCQISASYLCIMQLCKYVFPIDLPLCAQKWGFWRFWGWRCENIVFWPSKGTTLREYASVDVSHDKIGSTAWALGPWKDFAYKQEIKNWVVTLAIWGEVTPAATLTKCGVCGDMVDVITCAIFGDCHCRVKGCGCGERGKFAFSDWLDALPLQHWSPCD